MTKFENTELPDWACAIRNIPAKGYHQTKNGKYITFISNQSKTVGLGTFDTIEEAKDAVFNYRINRFSSAVKEYGLNPDDGVVFEGKYVVYENGMIFTLHGIRIQGRVDRNGYRVSVFNNRNRSFHRIVAMCFIPNPNELRDVNHKNGVKTDNRVENLEWVTHSDNVIHAYETGLAHKVYGEKHHAHKLTKKAVSYIKKNYLKRDPCYGAIALANKFGVDRTTITDVIRGKTWRDVR